MGLTIKLAWPANPSPEAVFNYQLFESVDGGPFNFKVNTAVPNVDILNPLPGQYSWKVQAQNFVGNSLFSPIAVGPTVPSTPGTITVTVIQS